MSSQLPLPLVLDAKAMAEVSRAIVGAIRDRVEEHGLEIAAWRELAMLAASGGTLAPVDFGPTGTLYECQAALVEALLLPICRRATEEEIPLPIWTIALIQGIDTRTFAKRARMGP